MQKVERQNHKDRGQKRLIGLLLCAVLLIGGVTAGILLSNKAKEEELISIFPEPSRSETPVIWQA